MPRKRPPSIARGGPSTAGASLDAGSHGPQRVDDAFHGPRTQGGVAGEDGEEGLGGQQSGQQAQRGAGVGGVQYGGGLPQAGATRALDAQGAGRRAFDAGAQGAQAADGSQAIGAGLEVVDGGLAPGDGVENGRPMTDGLVAGRLDGPAQAAGCSNRPLHGRRRSSGGRPSAFGGVRPSSGRSLSSLRSSRARRTSRSPTRRDTSCSPASGTSAATRGRVGGPAVM